MHWIIDLLIEKLKKDKQKDFEPEPLHIEDEYPYGRDEPDREPDPKEKVIIINL